METIRSDGTDSRETVLALLSDKRVCDLLRAVATAKDLSLLENGAIPEYIRASDEFYNCFAKTVINLVSEEDDFTPKRGPGRPKKKNGIKSKRPQSVPATSRVSKFLSDREALLKARTDDNLWNKLNLGQRQALIAHYRLEDKNVDTSSRPDDTAGIIGINKKSAINRIYGAKALLKSFDPEISLSVQSASQNRRAQLKWQARKNALAEAHRWQNRSEANTDGLFLGGTEDQAVDIGVEHEGQVASRGEADLAGIPAFWRYMIELADTEFLGHKEEDRRFLAVEEFYDKIIAIIKNSIPLRELVGECATTGTTEFFRMLKSVSDDQYTSAELPIEEENPPDEEDLNARNETANALMPKEKNNRAPLLRALIRRACSTPDVLQYAGASGALEDIEALLGKIEAHQNAVVLCNLPFVVSIAQRMQVLDYPMSLDEMVQWGNLGLIYAVKAFDPARGCSIRTYAHGWIQQSISRAINNTSFTIRQPAHIREAIIKVKKFIRLQLNETGLYPSEQEIALALGMSQKNVIRLLEISRNAYLPSLNRMVGGDDGDTELGDLLADRTLEPRDEAVMVQSKSKALEEVLGLLPPREEQILKRRFGMVTGIGETLEEIGRDIGLSKERVRQLEAQALTKLRQYIRHAGYSIADFL